MIKLDYVVTVPSELAAGLRGFTDNVSVTIEHSDKAIIDFDMQGELIEHFRQSVAEWFDVAKSQVVTEEEYQTKYQREGCCEPEQL